MVYFVHQDFTTSSFNSVNDSMYKWYQASGYNLMRRHATQRHTLTDYTDDDASVDNLNLIYRVPVGTSKYIAQNRIAYKSGIVTESDINLNTSHSFANSAKSGCYDTYSIFLHELGHTIGLGHVTDTTPVMYETYVTNKEKRSLAQDDIDGAKFIYK